jgi:RNA recognition motif-containing protein
MQMENLNTVEEKEEETLKKADSSTQDLGISSMLFALTAGELFDFLMQAAHEVPEFLEMLIAKADENENFRRLFIHGLTWGTTERDVEEVFKTYGEIQQVTIHQCHKDKFKAYAFVVYTEKEGAWRALECPKNNVVNNKEVVCQLASAKHGAFKELYARAAKYDPSPKGSFASSSAKQFSPPMSPPTWRVQDTGPRRPYQNANGMFPQQQQQAQQQAQQQQHQVAVSAAVASRQQQQQWTAAGYPSPQQQYPSHFSHMSNSYGYQQDASGYQQAPMMVVPYAQVYPFFSPFQLDPRYSVQQAAAAAAAGIAQEEGYRVNDKDGKEFQDAGQLQYSEAVVNGKQKDEDENEAAGENELHLQTIQ